LFFFYKIGEQEGGTDPAGGGLVPVGEERRWGKKGRRVNMT
jgi:hypothetical protein